MVGFGVLCLLLSPLPYLLPLFLDTKWCYITLDIKGHSGGSWFSAGKTCAFRFQKIKPDVPFIIDYSYGPLRKGHTATHALSHLHSAALADPLLQSEMSTDISDKVWLDSNETPCQEQITAPCQAPRREVQAHAKSPWTESVQIPNAEVSRQEPDFSPSAHEYDGYRQSPHVDMAVRMASPLLSFSFTFARH